MTELTQYRFTPYFVRGGRHVVASETMWNRLPAWERRARRAGKRARVLLTVDIFEVVQFHSAFGASPSMAELQARLFSAIDLSPNLDFVLPTAFPELADRMMPPAAIRGDRITTITPQRPNLILLAQASTQAEAETRVPKLLELPSRFRGLLLDPLLEPVRLPATWTRGLLGGARRTIPGLDWVVVGGAGGRGAQPCNVGWIRDIVRRCREAGIPCFVLRMGSNSVRTVVGGPAIIGGQATHRLSHEFKNKFKNRKGEDSSEWPVDLRVREHLRRVRAAETHCVLHQVDIQELVIAIARKNSVDQAECDRVMACVEIVAKWLGDNPDAVIEERKA